MNKSWLRTYQDKVYFGELFDVCSNRHKGNPESEAAFVAVKDRLTEAQNRVWQCVKDAGTRGRTNAEICLVLGMTPNCVSPRLTELKIAGRIEKIGTRLTPSRCSAAVWKVK